MINFSRMQHVLALLWFPEVKQFRSSAIPAAQRVAAGRRNPRLLTSETTGEEVYYTIEYQKYQKYPEMPRNAHF